MASTEVLFHSKTKEKGKGNILWQRQGKSPIRFYNGTYQTSSREEINDLLNSSLMKRNLIELVTPVEIVNQWLEGKTPDKLTEELLETVDAEGLRELAEVYNLPLKRHGNQPSVIKSMLKGKDVNNAAMFVIERHKTDEPVKDLFKLAREAGLIYHNKPWYKFMKGDEQKPSDDITLGRTEEEAQKWCTENESKIEKRLK